MTRALPISDQPADNGCERVSIPGTPWVCSTSGDGTGTVYLDCGFADPDVVWTTVAGEIAELARVAVIDRAIASASGRQNPAATVNAWFNYVSARICPNIQDPPSILVGWDDGAIFVQWLLVRLARQSCAAVLVDPLPSGMIPSLVETRKQELASLASPSFDGTNSSYASHFDGQTGAPITVILPGSQPESQLDQTRRRLQYDDLTRLPQARQVLAGRSRHHIPTERPDVVVDAIIGYLARGE